MKSILFIVEVAAVDLASAAAKEEVSAAAAEEEVSAVAIELKRLEVCKDQKIVFPRVNTLSLKVNFDIM